MSQLSASDLMLKAEQAVETWESGRFLLGSDDIDAVRQFINQDMMKECAQPKEIRNQWERWVAIRNRLESLGKEELNQVLTFKNSHRYSLNYTPPKKTTPEQSREYLRLLFKENNEEAAQKYWDSI